MLDGSCNLQSLRQRLPFSTGKRQTSFLFPPVLVSHLSFAPELILNHVKAWTCKAKIIHPFPHKLCDRPYAIESFFALSNNQVHYNRFRRAAPVDPMRDGAIILCLVPLRTHHWPASGPDIKMPGHLKCMSQ